jgi:prepilin-type N-terminal cleavage/methylation domain-containing protein
MPVQGYSLTELLLAIVIYSVIATFTVVKLINLNIDAKNRTLLKETISTLADVAYNGLQSGDLTTSNVETYFRSKLNAVTFCDQWQANAQGCWVSATQGSTANQHLYSGAILSSGVTLTGFNSYNSNDVVIYIDANGTSGPNTVGLDQLTLSICLGPSNCDSTNNFYGAIRPGRPGSVGPSGFNRAIGGDRVANSVLYDRIFAK